MDCMAGERMHKSVKECARNILNTSTYEVSLTKRVLSQHMALLEDSMLFVDKLIRPQPCAALGAAAFVAKAFTFENTLFSAGDIVIMNEVAWFTEGGATIDGRIAMLGRELHVVAEVATVGNVEPRAGGRRRMKGRCGDRCTWEGHGKRSVGKKSCE